MSEVPAAFAIAGGRAVVVTIRAPDREGDNQDAAAALPVGEDGGVLAVADGAGGLPAGDQAARIAMESLAESVLQRQGEGDLRERILHGFENANARIAALGLGAGSTLAAVQIEGRELRSYHVGDSVILVVGQRGRRKMQSVSHSPVGYGVEAGLISEQDAIEHEDLHLVSNLLGVSSFRIEMSGRLQLADRDTVIVGSDGLFDNLRTDEVVEIARKGSMHAAAERLVKLARRRMVSPREGEPSKPDDLSLVLFRPGS